MPMFGHSFLFKILYFFIDAITASKMLFHKSITFYNCAISISNMGSKKVLKIIGQKCLGKFFHVNITLLCYQAD